MISYRHDSLEKIVEHILKESTSRQSVCAALKYYTGVSDTTTCEKIKLAKKKAAIIKQMRKLEAL